MGDRVELLINIYARKVPEWVLVSCQVVIIMDWDFCVFSDRMDSA